MNQESRLMKKILQARIPSTLAALCVFAFVLFPALLKAQPVNNLCSAPTPLVSTPGVCGVATNGTLVAATYTAIPGVCAGSLQKDVWYTFVATSPNPTITTTGLTNPAIQLYTDCAGTLAPAPNCVTGASLTATSLTPGSTYLIRVYSTTGVLSAFTICITDPNYDLCANAIDIGSNQSCINIPGNFFGTGVSATSYTVFNCLGGGITRDVWFKFTAQTTNPTIKYTGVGAFASASAGIQLVSNSCGSNFTSYYCQNVTAGVAMISANFLTPGNVYMIRVYSTGGAPPATPGAAAFNICVTDPIVTPSNDECTEAVNISVMNSCQAVPGNIAGATPSTTPLGGTCVAPNMYDVWYKFTAIATSSTITVTPNPNPNNFTNGRIEVFATTSGDCSTLTSISCGASPLNTIGLIAGNTYYVRVYSTTGPPPDGNARFDICITSPLPAVRYGNSYVNMSRRTGGGVVQKGDTLEIRMTFQYSLATNKTNIRFVDNVPTKTAMLTTSNDSIRIITNEGLTYKRYTLGAGDDAATYKAVPGLGEYNIRLNVGFASNPGIPANNTATEFASATGTMNKTNKPTLFNGSVLFAIAYRVKVTGNPGDTIVLNPAQFIYRTGGLLDTTLTSTSYKILITTPLSLCSNSIGLNNAEEFGGTFGSGTAINRTTDLTSPIQGYSFVNDINAYNSLGDGRYALVKNISPRNSTNKNASRAYNCGTLAWNDPINCNNRMHGGHWYIDGDHTGTVNAAGNAPPGAGTSAGYMLEVNADYVPSEIYRQTLNNLCPNTYYEFSAWFRNICPTCGSDSIGQQFAGTPTAPASGYPGVLPNLSFALDGLDYYSTGAIDTVGWLKKGFVFRTGISQTSATFSIRNNAQGGGGNDWVMDDIAVATCLPTMSYSPTINPNVCRSNPVTIADTISSFFKNYTTYKWQRSTNSGTSWTDITGVTTIPDTNYYITTYTIPPWNTYMSNSGDLYRVVVATTAANLTDPDCNISDGVTITLTVIDCGIPLKSDLLSFNGKLVADKGNLSWTTSKETEPVKFNIERSTDGTNFTLAGTVNGHNDNSSEINAYSFVDPQLVTDKIFYRLVMIDPAGTKKYSRTIQLSKTGSDKMGLVNVINPFNQSLDFDVAAPGDAKIEVLLIDPYGKVVNKNSYLVHAGINALSIPNTGNLPPGTYIFRISNNDTIINRKVLKKTL